MHRKVHDLPRLLAELNPNAEIAERHLWLIHVLQWVRAAEPSVEVAIGRVDAFLDAFEKDTEARQRLQAWWLTLLTASTSPPCWPTLALPRARP